MSTAVQLELIEGLVPVELEEQPQLSPQRRRTIRQLRWLRAGIHPLSAVTAYVLKLHAEAADMDDRTAGGRRCGNCALLQRVEWHNRSYLKCLFGKHHLDGNAYLDELPRVSHCAATDVRRWWPGCVDHEWGDRVSPDAARSGPGGG